MCPAAAVCPTKWTKINQQEDGVEWGARDERHGRWEVASRVCGRKLKLLHRSGGVGCFDNQISLSNFGCRNHEVSDHVAPHVTKGKGSELGSEYAIAPYAGDPKVTAHPSYPSGSWYKLPGFNSMSPYLEFDLPHTNTYYCFENGTEYHLWYGEDMIDWGETDNLGTAYTDIYIMS